MMPMKTRCRNVWVGENRRNRRRRMETLAATGRVIWVALLGAYSISFLFQHLDTALLTKWRAEVDGLTAG